MASTAVSTLPNAVITTTGNAALWRLMGCRNSRPFMPGSLRSVNTKSMGFSLSNLRPVLASSAEKVVKPSSPLFRRNAGSVISHAFFDSVNFAVSPAGPRFPALDTQLPAGGAHGVIGILHDIHECLLAQALIERHERQIGTVVFLYSNRRSFPELSDVIQGTIEDRGDVRRREIGVQGTREIQETRDQRAQPVGLGGNVSGKFRCQRIRLPELLSQHFRRALDYSQRIANLVGESGRELAQSGETLGPPGLGLRLLQAAVGLGKGPGQLL